MPKRLVGAAVVASLLLVGSAIMSAEADIKECPTTLERSTLRCFKREIRALAGDLNAHLANEAFASTSHAGDLLDSVNVDAMTQPETGVWCFDLPFTPRFAFATVFGFAGFGNQIIHASVAPGASDACPSPHPADGAATMRLPNGSPTDTGFFIFFRG